MHTPVDDNRQVPERPSRFTQLQHAPRYPTQSLRFLQHVNFPNEGIKPVQRLDGARDLTSLRLNIVIIGAGLGGLATGIALARRGHRIRVLEQAAELGEVGAGIQIPPNSGRLLHRWGVDKYLQRRLVMPEAINLRRWNNGQLIGYTSLGDSYRKNFEIPYYVVHRAHFHEALKERAIELGVLIDLNMKVVRYDETKAVVFLADGHQSQARRLVGIDMDQSPSYEGWAAYRATVDSDKIRAEPDIAWLLERPNINLWIGPNRHVMSYQIASGESFNMVLCHIDKSSPESWVSAYAKEDIQAEFSGWNPNLTKILGMIDSCAKWPLKVGRRLSSWTSSSSKLVVLGDAAHAMLPYMSQGAAMAVEDGAALAVALDKISSKDEIPFALKMFEKERIARSGDMMDASNLNGMIWHLPDGPEQRARDASMSAEVAGEPFASSANQWSDPVTAWWAYGYDAEQAIEDAWQRAVHNLIITAV